MIAETLNVSARDDYRWYQKTTSTFILSFPRKERAA